MTATRLVERDGIALPVRAGGPSRGEPVLLLHGFPQDSRCWAAVEPALHAAGLRTLAPDQRGYAPGARPDAVSAYRLEELAQDALAVLDDAGLGSAHVVGHDWGGGLAWYLGATQPARVRSLTVLSTPHPSALARSMVGSLQPLRSLYMAWIQVPVLPEVVLARTLAATLRASGLPEDLAAEYASRFDSPQALRGPLAWYRAAARHPPMRILSGSEVIGIPTTYVWGRHDPALGRAAADATSRYVTGAEYRFVELDAGHWLPELCPDEVAAAVVDRVTRGGAAGSGQP
ncbi:MAG: alpha/beta fold hydrolase [Dermatophilaceae bacterium]